MIYNVKKNVLSLYDFEILCNHRKNISNIKGFMRCVPVGKGGKIKIIFVH